MRQIFIFIAVCLQCVLTQAQWKTPTIDGVINPSDEYGSNNQLNAGRTAQTWYMTWDSANLYVAITNANLSEGAVIYIGANPPSPVNGGRTQTAISPASIMMPPNSRHCRSERILSPTSRMVIASTETQMAAGVGAARQQR